MSFVTSEPVPPGFEEDMSLKAIIVKQVEAYKSGPLVGIEYIVELHEANQLRPDYFCVLCNTCNDNRSIFSHWTSFTHRSNYIKTHFQKAFNEINKLRRGSSISTELVTATARLVHAIVDKYGRNLEVLAVSGDHFRHFRAKICAQVREKFHFDECQGYDFLDITRKILMEIDNRHQIDETLKITLKLNPNETKSKKSDEEAIALDAISSDDDNFGPITTDAKKLRKQHGEERAINRSPPTIGGNKGKLQKPPTPKELSIQASQVAQERYKFEKFRCSFELQLKQLRDETETYETNPEKHPDYQDEWKQFWNRRYKELQEEKKVDPNRYDYKPEWIAYWKERRIELFNQAVIKIKDDLKEKYKLAAEDDEKINKIVEHFKFSVDGSSSSPTNSLNDLPAISRRKANFRSNRAEPVIDISDDEPEPSPPRRTKTVQSFFRARSRSPSLTLKRSRLSARLGKHPHSPVRRDLRRRLTRSRSQSRSRSRSPRRSLSPYGNHTDRLRSRDMRERDNRRISRDRISNQSRSRDGYSERHNSLEHDGYTRHSRHYVEPVETFRVLDPRVYPEYNEPSRSSSPAGSGKGLDGENEEGPLTVVSVLRMLSAMEEHLGSLGPKALHLLSKALAMEKVQANAADDLLLVEDNCVFLETTKEKLKGLLLAKMLEDQQKVRVVKKLISNIATIVYEVNNKDKEGAKKDKLTDAQKPKEFQLPFSKQIVSSKLATALLSHGVENATTEDMNKMVHFFTLLASTNKLRLKNDSSLPLNFSEVINRLGLPVITSPIKAQSINIDSNISVIMKEVEQKLAKEAVTPAVGEGSTSGKQTGKNDSSNGMELLTDSDLQTLLQNFKFLSNEEQVHLISHLRKLEVQDPSRVDRLRKYVNVADQKKDAGETCSELLTRLVAGTTGGRLDEAPSSSRASNATINVKQSVRGAAEQEPHAAPAIAREKIRRVNPMARNSPHFMLDDDDDDDYNFEELVIQTKDSNGRKMNMQSPHIPQIVSSEPSTNSMAFKQAPSKMSIKDTTSLIANLMDTLAGNKSQKSPPVNANQQAQLDDNNQMMRNNMMPMSHPQQQQQQQQHHHQQMYGGPNNNAYFQRYYGNDQMGPCGGPVPVPGPGQMGGVGPGCGPVPNPFQGNPMQPHNMGGGYGNNMGSMMQNSGPQNYNNFGGSQMNPWTNNGMPYGNMPQNYGQQQQQQQRPPFNNFNRK